MIMSPTRLGSDRAMLVSSQRAPVGSQFLGRRNGKRRPQLPSRSLPSGP